MTKFIFEKVENIVGKGENAGYQHSLFLRCFQKNNLVGGCWKSRLCGSWRNKVDIGRSLVISDLPIKDCFIIVNLKTQNILKDHVCL